MQTIDELLEEIDVFRGLADEHLDLIAGCALMRVYGDGETPESPLDAVDDAEARFGSYRRLIASGEFRFRQR